MENRDKNLEKDIEVYPKYKRARRDVAPQKDDTKTRIDMPTITEDIIISSNPAKKVVEKPSTEKKEAPKTFLLEEEEEDRSTGANLFSALGKSVAYLIFVICASIIVSYLGITIANDLFAFVKPDKEISITITEDTSFRELAGMLEKEGAVNYPLFLRIYYSFKNRGVKNPTPLEPGEYKVLANLNYDEIISTFSKKKAARDIVRITFPEGMSADEMIDLFLENGVGTREGFVKAVSSSLIYDMDYRFLKELQEMEKKGFDDGRIYALEGYLYPDTYDFYTDSSEIDAISKLLRTFNVRFEEAYYDRCEELSMSVDDIVNIASIVQMETKYESEYETVSSLYHNRLNAPSRFPRLQCDSTYLYAFPERREGLTLDEMKESSNPYSTYSHDGLPPSAICSPSLNAIIAALYPSAIDNNGRKYTYYYMVARPDGYHYFASTEDEHNANIVKARNGD